MTQELAIDLGTANTVIFQNDKIILDEPSILATDNSSGKLIALGQKAKLMAGKENPGIRTIRPLRDGVIADFNAAEMMIRGFIKQANSNRSFLFSPNLKIVVGIPSGSTEVEIRAVRDSTEHAGGRDVYLIFEPMAAALGVGLDVEAPKGNMVVDIGGGTVDVVVLQYGIPQPFDNDFPARGVIWTYGAIRQEAKARLGLDLSEAIINLYLHGEPVRIGEDAVQIIRGKVSQYAQRLLMALREKQLPISTAYVLLMGGGACLVRNAWYQMESTFGKIDFLGEIKATAMGSEVMARRTLEIQEQRAKNKVM